MWRRWAKPSSSSPSRTTTTAAAVMSSNHFTYSGFREVPELFTTTTTTEDPKRSVLHRLRVTTARLRTGNYLHSPAPTQRHSPKTKLASEIEADESLEAAVNQWSSSESHHDNASPLTPLEPWCTSTNLPLGSETRIVVYFTSLRVVRSTFQDCRAVRSILRGFCVSMDERDLSMDSGFLDELKGVLGLQDDDDDLRLPRVFIGGRYIGGAEEVRHLHETGALKKLVEGLPPAAEPGVCETCSGYKFLLCHVCSGSHKCPADSGDGGFRSCSSCNENGLLRCPSCVPSDPSI